MEDLKRIAIELQNRMDILHNRGFKYKEGLDRYKYKTYKITFYNVCNYSREEFSNFIKSIK